MYCIYDNSKGLWKSKLLASLIIIPGVYYFIKGYKEKNAFHFYSGGFFIFASILSFRRILKEPINVYLLKDG
jgi:hypothetical protein